VKLRNLTPHPVDIHRGPARLTLPPEVGPVPRIVETSRQRGTVDVDGFSIPLLQVTASDVAGLPAPEEGTLHVVARVVAEAAPERDDLVVPYEPVRDAQGSVIGCRSLARIVLARGAADR
jgi:hypothetical protein